MEVLMLVLGAVVLVLGVLALAVGMALTLAMWETWWLHPMWAVIAVPAGLPQIDYWHLFAVNLFVSAMFFPPANQDYAKEEDKTTRTVSQVPRIAVAYARPVVAYFIIRWALGVQP